jgi:hypothetical protein
MTIDKLHTAACRYDALLRSVVDLPNLTDEQRVSASSFSNSLWLVMCRFRQRNTDYSFQQWHSPM